jgi:hypothetical protein
MLHKALLSALPASLIGSSLLTGCATPFERYYETAVTAYVRRLLRPSLRCWFGHAAQSISCTHRTPSCKERRSEQQLCCWKSISARISTKDLGSELREKPL